MKWKNKGHEYDDMARQLIDRDTRYYIWGRLSENSNGAKFSPTGDGKIEANSQCNSHFMAENSNKNGIKSHRTLVFGQSGGGNIWDCFL